MNVARVFAASILGILLSCPTNAYAQTMSWKWHEVDASGKVSVNLFLFFSQTCPRCTEALQFVDALQKRHTWLNVLAYEITANPSNRSLYMQMADSLKRPAGPTPAFFYCKQMEIGYTSYEHTGQRIEQGLIRWRDALQKHYDKSRGTAQLGLIVYVASMMPSDPPSEVLYPDLPDLPVEVTDVPDRITVPIWGEVEANHLSLPLATLVLAACDSFNPCAFFVLLLLLSLLVHGQSRSRMIVVGGVFVFFSGFMYFLFMAAWLNLFFVIGHLALITTLAGIIAVSVGVLNVKDYFLFKRGPSLSIPESARPGLFTRMSRLIRVTSWPSLIGGAAALAALANLYELLCTTGFPLVYTRILTLRDLPMSEYYAYLVFYNVIYVIPLAIIVGGFALTLGARKLTEFQGRILKLLSGLMMTSLGLALVLAPTFLHSLLGAAALLLGAMTLTAAIVALNWALGKRPRGSASSSKSPSHHAA